MGDALLDELESELSATRATEIEPSGFLSTGSLELNWAVSGRPVRGGLPIGKITALAGRSFTGKSLTLQRAIAMAQKQGGRALVNDAENSFNIDRMEGLGIDPNRLSLISTQTIEEHHEKVVKFLDVVEEHGAEAPVVLGVDSLGDLTTEEELEHGLEKRTVAAFSRQAKKHLRIVGNRMAALNVCYILVQHVYQQIGQQFGDPRTPSGGEGPKYRSSVQIMFNTTKELDEGVVVRGKMLKTRLTVPNKEFEYFVPWDREPAEYGGVIPMGMKSGILQQNGHSLDVVNPETGEVVKEKAVKAHKTSPSKRASEEDKLVEEHPEVLDWLEDDS